MSALRWSLVVTGALLSGCAASTDSPLAPAGSQSSTKPSPKPHAADSAAEQFTGRLADGGNWVPRVGDAVAVGVGYDVRARYLFVDQTGGDTLHVAAVDSVAYYNAPSSTDTAGALGPRYPARDCAPALVLECQPSAGTTYVGEYLVSVHYSAGVTGQFQLLVYPP